MKYDGVVRIYKGGVDGFGGDGDCVAYEEGFVIHSDKPLTSKDIVDKIKKINFKEIK